jgi:hypothetical protein
MAMAVLDAASDSIGVDTEEDAKRVEEILLRMKMGAGAAREHRHSQAAASVFTFKEKLRDESRVVNLLATTEV